MPQGLAAESARRHCRPPQNRRRTAATAEGGYWDSVREALASVVKMREIGETDWTDLARALRRLGRGRQSGGGHRPDRCGRGRQACRLEPMARRRAAARLRLEAALAEAAEAVQRQVTALGGAQ